MPQQACEHTRVVKKFSPSQPGAIKLARRYGASLVCVRYRESMDGVTRFITVELLVFDRAVESVREDIRRIAEQFGGSLPAEELALFDVYLHMLDDSAIPGDVRERIRLGQWAQGALRQVIREHLRTLKNVPKSK